MLQVNKQLSFSYYSPLYDELIPKDHFFRKVKEHIDFSFANEILKDSYCEKFGRPAKEPEFMLKLFFLQKLKNLSDRGVIEEASYNLAYKFFLDLNPEERICDPSLLSKFRRNHIATEQQLRKLLHGIIIQAVEAGLITDKTLIVDATHTKSHATKENNTAQLQRLSKNLRRALYTRHPELKDKFPEKPEKGSGFGKELAYTKKLMKVLEKEDQEKWENKIKKEYRRLRDHLAMIAEAEDSLPNKAGKQEKTVEPQSMVDPDAKTGYKSENNSFFGYKSHLSMTESGLITGIEVTSGEDSDGKHLKKLIEQSIENGVEVKAILADKAYGFSDNLEYLEQEDIKAYIRLHPFVMGAEQELTKGMSYNKDADTMQCQGGYLAEKKTTAKDRGKKRHIYWFDVKKCQECPYREGCYKPGAKTRTVSLKEKSQAPIGHLEFQESEEFKERIKNRYKIEAKNGEMKTSHGLEYCNYRGLFGMQIQTYMTVLTVNIKRMIKLLTPRKGGIISFFMLKIEYGDKNYVIKIAGTQVLSIPAKKCPFFSSLVQMLCVRQAGQPF